MRLSSSRLATRHGRSSQSGRRATPTSPTPPTRKTPTTPTPTPTLPMPTAARPRLPPSGTRP
ncbi:MAG: hypothetical protein F4117_00665 [Acidimicrobiales bacterium]|nr:hypothetical protein [Acidimicrobiales bacterium]MYI11064.1 hypothetical protein [Acidimicrobiales bacterium]